MSNSPTDRRDFRQCTPGLLLLLASCAAGTPTTRILDEGSEHAHCERIYDLPADEAACLVAESMSYAFPNTQRDSLRPVARAERIDAGRWRVEYARGAKGYLPVANGYFERESAGTRLSYTRPRKRLFELLPGLRFVSTTSVGTLGTGHGRVVIDIEGLEAGRSVVRCTAVDTASRWSARELENLHRLLVGASALKRGFALCDEGHLAEAATTIRRALRTHRRGFSHVHDPLLANAFHALGVLEYERGRLHEARRAFARGRLLLPPDVRQLTLEARLHERLAQVRETRAKLERGRLLESSKDLESRRVLALRHGAEALLDATKTKGDAGSVAKAVLARGDTVAALRWANRALDLLPGDADALALKASVLAAQGRHRSAHQYARMAQLSRPADSRGPTASIDPRAIEPALALRSLLRSEPTVEVIADEATQRLVAILGAERCLRICRTEGVDVRILEQAIEWFESVHDERSRFLAGVLTSSRRRTNARPPTLGLEHRHVEPARIGASSGFRPRRTDAEPPK